MIIPQKIRTPYSLDEIEQRFSLAIDDLEKGLDYLAGEEIIFSHDVNAVDCGRYYISAYATLRVVLLLRDESSELITDLKCFFNEIPSEGGDELSDIYSAYASIRHEMIKFC